VQEDDVPREEEHEEEQLGEKARVEHQEEEQREDILENPESAGLQSGYESAVDSLQTGNTTGDDVRT
jgi:hypothetical protein